MSETADAARPAPLVVVGDALLDRDLAGACDRLAPDSQAPVVADCEERLRPGGAALAAYLAARAGREVTLLTACGEDRASRRLRALLARWVTVVPLPLDGTLPEKTRILDRGRPVVRLDRGAGRALAGTEAARTAVRSAGAVLVADYGRGTADALREVLAERAGRVPIVWDPHPGGQPPVHGIPLVTPAAEEARHFATRLPVSASPRLPRSVAQRAQALTRGWGVGAVAVTLGSRGALLSHGGGPLWVPAAQRHRGDACGAGDQFAATAAGSLADGGSAERAVRSAVTAATDYVRRGGAAALDFRAPGEAAAPAELSPEHLVARVRASGGTVVAAGGCFDLLHTGHIGLLEEARRAGDCLVVCLNSDSSVGRLKGAGRPIVPAVDRARMLRALACVDAVAVFDEDTPERLLDRLRPHLWVKGGDYRTADLPEAALLERWGGRAVVLPHRDGTSSSQLVARAAASVAALRPEHGGAPAHAATAVRPPPAPARRRATPVTSTARHRSAPDGATGTR